MVAWPVFMNCIVRTHCFSLPSKAEEDKDLNLKIHTKKRGRLFVDKII